MKTAHDKPRQAKPKARRKPALPGTKPARQVKKPVAGPAPTAVGDLRTRLGLKQADFARLLAVSVRSLATLESGAEPTEPVARRLTELERLIAGLSEVIKPESLGKWLQDPNPALDKLKPTEVIERGESDRLWQMVYFLRSGVPS